MQLSFYHTCNKLDEMPSKNIPPKNNQSRTSGCSKVMPTPPKQPEQSLKCPRCDSVNTKFCYYNNYNLKQPRYFCKGCRRYWTKGGVLRTIPFGGGSRRRKVMKSSNSKYGMGNDYLTGGLDLFQGLNMDCQLATPTSTSTSIISNSSMGQELNFTLSSIESLSSINQDLYWKLQQQRLAMLFGEQIYTTNNSYHCSNTPKEGTSDFISYFSLQNNTTTQNNYDTYCSTKEGENGNLVTEWLFDSPGATVDPVAVDNCCDDRGLIEGTSSWINGIEGWEDFNQYGLIMDH